MKNLNEELYFLKERLEKEQAEEEAQAKKISLEHEKTLTKKDEEVVLEKREKTSTKKLGGGANETVFVELKDDGSAIFKPKAGEYALLRTEVKAGTYYKRERAAYLVDQFLGFDLVPPTVIRKIDGKEGSLQEFIPNAPVASRCDESQWNKEELKKLWVFDYIIYNSDRHGSNLLIKDEKVYAIDNGLSFGKDSLGLFGGFSNEPIGDGVAEKIKMFLSWKQGRQALRNLLCELIEEKEADACLHRIEKVGKMTKGEAVNVVNREKFSFNPLD